jgi:hypothetical protein
MKLLFDQILIWDTRSVRINLSVIMMTLLILIQLKVLGVWADGLLDIWGTVRGPTWTNLDGNVNYGATTITVAEDVQWYVNIYVT